MYSKKFISALATAASLAAATSAVAQEPADDGQADIEAPPNVEKTLRLGEPITPFAELLAEGLDEHPAVVGRRNQVQIEEARLRGVGLVPDPSVRLSFSNIPWNEPGLSSSPMSGIELMASQPLWWPGELQALREEVQAEAEALKPLIDEEQIELVIDAAGFYYDIYRIDRTVAALEELKEPVREFLKILEGRIPTGKASVAQVERVRLELLRINDRIFFLQYQRPQKVARLNALLNRPIGAVVNPPVAPTEEGLEARVEQEIGDLEELVEMAMKRRPIVEALERRKEVARAEARTAQYEKYPDLSVFGGWRFRGAQANGLDEGTDLVTIGVSSTIPIWSGERAEAAEDVAQATVISLDSAIADFRLELRGRIAEQLAELHHFIEHAEYYREKLIPQAVQTRKAALAGFAAGQAAYEDWIQAEERIVDLRATLAEFEAGIRRQRAIILALIGELAPVQAEELAEGDK